MDGTQLQDNLARRMAADAGVITRCQNGELKAFEELVRRYHASAVRLSFGWLRNMDDATDASQDAFVKALEALPRFDVRKPFFPWFYVILKNTCFKRLRFTRSRREQPMDQTPDVAAPERKPSSYSTDTLKAALGRLSGEHREVLVLRHWDDKSYDEIAAALSVPIGTVMSRLHNARRALRAVLEADR
jgi:RNA polymerase sigma-70 factor (ECF subfamily)